MTELVHQVLLAVREGSVCQNCHAILPHDEIPEGEWYRARRAEAWETQCYPAPPPVGQVGLVARDG